MEIVIIGFGLMTVNLYSAAVIKLKGGYLAYQYFVAGFCCSIGMSALIKLLLV